MTQSHHDHAPPPGPSPGDDARLEAERIAAELAALGEDPVDDDELALAISAAVAEDHDVRTVATLVELSAWTAPVEGLLPLERHRVWQRVAKRISTPAASPEVAPAANGGGAWRGVLASLSLVASVTLLLHVDVAPPPSAEDRAALESMGEATRAVLEGTLPGERDGTRARSLAEGYAERLQATRGAER